MGDIPSGPVVLLFFNNVIFLSISRLDRLISDIYGTGLEHGLVKSCGAWSCPTFNFSAIVEKKQFITAVVGPLTSLSMQSIRECRVYNNWKVARLTPVFKKDDPTVMSNYRPLSLLSVPSKILESCVADMIAKHVFSENEALVTDNQWAYRKGRSTELLLIHVTETWRRAFDNKLLWAPYS